jgi:hypothetical protein
MTIYNSVRSPKVSIELIQTCVNCIYGNMVRHPPYWEFKEEFDIGCNYPKIGNLSLDRESLVDCAESDGDLQEEATNCSSYLYYC